MGFIWITIMFISDTGEKWQPVPCSDEPQTWPYRTYMFTMVTDMIMKKVIFTTVLISIKLFIYMYLHFSQNLICISTCENDIGNDLEQIYLHDGFHIYSHIT